MNLDDWHDSRAMREIRDIKRRGNEEVAHLPTEEALARMVELARERAASARKKPPTNEQ